MITWYWLFIKWIKNILNAWGLEERDIYGVLNIFKKGNFVMVLKYMCWKGLENYEYKPKLTQN